MLGVYNMWDLFIQKTCIDMFRGVLTNKSQVGGTKSKEGVHCLFVIRLREGAPIFVTRETQNNTNKTPQNG